MIKVLPFVWFIGHALAAGLCPIYGPVFPPAKNPSSSPSLQAALGKLKAGLDDAFATGNSPFGPVVDADTYSIQIFSTAEEGSLFDYHHRGSSLTKGVGAAEVNGDAVYRMGSVTKIFAVYMLLIQAGIAVFSDLVTKHLPELSGKPGWEEITVGAVAGQIAGVPADVYDLAPIAGGSLADAYPGVFPVLDKEEAAFCIANATQCTRKEFLDELVKRPFTYASETTPGYSNAAFVVLGLVLESITGTSWNDNFKTIIIEPLGLNRTAATTPDSSWGVLVGNETFSGWDIDLSAATAMGGVFASATDMSKVGRAILASKLLPQATTRAWLKPTSFTSSLIGAVGRPWEIYRASLDPANNRVVDLYTKGGNLGIYDTNLILIPDFNVGVTILSASEFYSITYGVSGLVADILIPALEDAAREEAEAAYSGTYTATNGVNSTVTLSTTPGKPGLGVEQWISNSTNMIELLGSSPETFRLYPSNTNGAPGESPWRAVSGIDFGYDLKGPFSACPTWYGVGRPPWGLYGIDAFSFQLAGDGKAKSLEPKAFKIVLEREAR
ncbi:beta-lactamase/transpeptidase-like protein [Massariosphaeria phaeospora]|uniref:Beta-lactamase/transpeptidase-like protein n=1 Tax=Massariosphaeria phaeospora TaxID=100035 RepID=A0A7C8M3A6_9PLEO|nr:beta-lactamase/transpeptidase-like protein [Massariosphaeria phaeospora]